MLLFSVLSSGSKANATYVTDGLTHLLIDCGLSAKETARRLNMVGANADEIDAILITHEHSDHVSGIPIFAKRHNTVIYGNSNTLETVSEISSNPNLQLNIFEVGFPFAVGNIIVEPFSVPHDAVDPVGFRLSNDGVSLGIITDIGRLTNTVRAYTKNLDALVLESNHDSELLKEAPYPWELKQRIRGHKGHLSNEAAGQLIEELSADTSCKLQVVVAAHVSEKSNYYELALEGFKKAWKGQERDIQFMVADINTPTPLFRIGPTKINQYSVSIDREIKKQLGLM